MGPSSATLACPGCAERPLAAMGGEARGLVCAACGGVFVASEGAPEVFGGSVRLLPAPVPLDAPEPPRCPVDGGALLERWAFGREDLAVLCCGDCGGSWLPPGRLARLRAELAQRGVRAPRPRAPNPERVSVTPPPGARIDRIAFDHPSIDLAALPIAFALALMLTATRFGRLLVFPVQLVFHELGHAIPSWLSSRAALPLPCGITFTREEPSVFTGGCFVFLVAVLAYAGHRERKPYAVTVAAVLFVCWAFFTLVLDAEQTRELVLLGGIAGELWLSAFVIASFYFPVPDRLRWDFFRVLLVPFAAMSFVATTRLWTEIANERAGLPLGSLFGAHGDGSGDLDRLMAELGWTEAGLVRLYLSLAGIACATLTVLYVVFAVRALRRAARARHG